MVRKSKGLAAILCVLALVFAVAACSTPAGRSVGQVVDDGTIATKVRAKLMADSVLQSFGIGVRVFQGEVTLTGAVNVSDQRDRAEELVLETQGVTGVNNLLTVK